MFEINISVKENIEVKNNKLCRTVEIEGFDLQSREWTCSNTEPFIWVAAALGKIYVIMFRNYQIQILYINILYFIVIINISTLFR